EALTAALRQQRREQFAVVLLRHVSPDMAGAVAGDDAHVVGIIAWLDHHQPQPVEAEMTLDQRQRAAPDRAEADHDDRAGDLAMDRKSGVGHFSELPAALIGGVKPQKY